MAAWWRAVTETYMPDGAAPMTAPKRPAVTLPAGACDSHCHIFGPFDRFPLPEDRSFNPHETPEPALRRLHDHLGIDRAVIVQSQGHGLDHAALLDALDAGAGRYRGVALLRPGMSRAALSDLDRRGIRGVRFSFMPHLGRPDLAMVRAVIAEVAPLGWHVAIHVAGDGLAEMAPFIAAIDAPVVIDHMARPERPDDPACLDGLRRLLDRGRVWVKLSCAERLTRAGAPYDDVAPLMRALIDHAPDRMLWGSDWPHVNLHGPVPDDGALVDRLTSLTSEAERQQILVTTPAQLFGF